MPWEKSYWLQIITSSYQMISLWFYKWLHAAIFRVLVLIRPPCACVTEWVCVCVYPPVNAADGCWLLQSNSNALSLSLTAHPSQTEREEERTAAAHHSSVLFCFYRVILTFRMIQQPGRTFVQASRAVCMKLKPPYADYIALLLHGT